MKKVLFLLVSFISLSICASSNNFSSEEEIYQSCCTCLCLTSPVGGQAQHIGLYPKGRINQARIECKKNENKSCNIVLSDKIRKSKYGYCHRSIHLKPHRCKKMLD